METIDNPTNDAELDGNELLENSIEKHNDTRAIIEKIEQFGDKIDQLTDKCNGVIRRTDYQEELSNRIYDEMRYYKELNSVVDREVKPLLLDLLLLNDNIEKVLNICQSKVEPEVTNLIQSLHSELNEILYRQHVEEIIVSDEIDPALHRVTAVRVVPGLDKPRISDVFRKGFFWKSKVFRFSDIEIERGDTPGDAAKIHD